MTIFFRGGVGTGHGQDDDDTQHDTLVAELLINETEQINIMKEVTGLITKKNLKAPKMKQQNYLSITPHFKLLI